MATKPAARICESVINDDRLVLFGLLSEVDARLGRGLSQALEASCGIPLATFEVLVRIARSPEGRLTMSEIASQTVHSSGGTTRLVDRIEEAGLVRRANCPNDRRTTWVEMTDEGIALLESATAAHLEQVEAQLTSKLDAHEVDALIEILTKLNGGPASCAG